MPTGNLGNLIKGTTPQEPRSKLAQALTNLRGALQFSRKAFNDFLKQPRELLVQTGKEISALFVPLEAAVGDGPTPEAMLGINPGALALVEETAALQTELGDEQQRARLWEAMRLMRLGQMPGSEELRSLAGFYKKHGQTALFGETKNKRGRGR